MRFETPRSRSFRWGLVLVLLAAVFTSTWFVRAPGRAGLEKSSVLADEEEMEWFTACLLYTSQQGFSGLWGRSFSQHAYSTLKSPIQHGCDTGQWLVLGSGG